MGTTARKCSRHVRTLRYSRRVLRGTPGYSRVLQGTPRCLAAHRRARRHEDVQSQLPMAASSGRCGTQGTSGYVGYSGVLTPAGTGCSRREALPSSSNAPIFGGRCANEFRKNDRPCRLFLVSSWGLRYRPRIVARLIDGDLRTVFSARSCDSYHAGVHTTVVASVRPGPSSSRLWVMGDGSGKST